jgi:hypothetical protein
VRGVELNAVVKLMDQVTGDMTVPRNIRAAVAKAKETLKSEDALNVRIGTAIHILDEVINDPNMPFHARTRIWSIVSQLEELRKKI